MLNNPKIGEPVLFDCAGSTYAGRVSRVDKRGFMIEPEHRINNAAPFENIRRPEVEEWTPTQAEFAALKIKKSGKYAQELRNMNPTLYAEANALLVSGALRGKRLPNS